jgi:Domain of unknown function (DUF4136)
MRLRVFISAFLAVSLGGCAATIPPVEVTRFHLGTEIAAGPVRIAGDSTLEATPYVAAVSQAMAGRGFTDVGLTKTPPLYVATVAQSRLTRAQAKRSPISIGIGGGSFGRNVGVGVGTSVGIGGGVQQIVVTRLSVQLKRASDQQAVWEGRAETEAPAKAPASQAGLAAKKLADALFWDFPGVSGTTITVK